MKIDLNSGAYIQIGGELGKYNSIPIENLVKIAEGLQNLLYTLAKIDLPSEGAIDLNNFKIELIDFKKGSAVPQFAYSSRVENKTGLNWSIHRNEINEKFEKLIEISNSGDYSKLIDLYPEPVKRNPIVEDFYFFSSSFGNSPVHIVDFDNKNNVIQPVYKISKFKSKVKQSLIGAITQPTLISKESNVGVGKIIKITKGGKERNNVVTFYPNGKFSLEFAPEVIVFKSAKYILRFPLRCLFEEEDNYFIIQSELLGIIGTGSTEDEAENSFAEEFDFVYNKLNSLEDSMLTDNNKFIKNNFNHLVLKVEK